MTTRLIASIACLQSWEPGELMARTPQVWWSDFSDLYVLSDVSLTISPTIQPDGSCIKVAPGDVDPVDGTLSARAEQNCGLGYRLDTADGLALGDLLITANRPTVVVSAAHVGLTFSSTFLAIRTNPGFDAVWLWAISNSTKGIAYRRSATTRNGLNQRLKLRAGDLSFPGPTDSWTFTLMKAAELLRDLSVRTKRHDAGQSWTRWQTLPTTTPWHWLLSLPDPSLFEKGFPLKELLEGVRVGRPRQTTDEAREGWLPVLGVAQMRGAVAVQYADPERELDSVPGDILLQEVGILGAARAVESPCIVGSGVLRLRLHDVSQTAMVTAFLNSPLGQRQRRVLAAGATLHRLTRLSVGEFRVSEDQSATAEKVSLSASVDEWIFQ